MGEDDVAKAAAEDVARLLLGGNGLRTLVALVREEGGSPAAGGDQWEEIAGSEGIWAWSPDRPVRRSAD